LHLECRLCNRPHKLATPELAEGPTVVVNTLQNVRSRQIIEGGMRQVLKPYREKMRLARYCRPHPTVANVPFVGTRTPS